jgi:hypothetical protein
MTKNDHALLYPCTVAQFLNAMQPTTTLNLVSCSMASIQSLHTTIDWTVHTHARNQSMYVVAHMLPFPLKEANHIKDTLQRTGGE